MVLRFSRQKLFFERAVLRAWKFAGIISEKLAFFPYSQSRENLLGKWGPGAYLWTRARYRARTRKLWFGVEPKAIPAVWVRSVRSLHFYVFTGTIEFSPGNFFWLHTIGGRWGKLMDKLFRASRDWISGIVAPSLHLLKLWKLNCNTLKFCPKSWRLVEFAFRWDRTRDHFILYDDFFRHTTSNFIMALRRGS